MESGINLILSQTPCGKIWRSRLSEERIAGTSTALEEGCRTRTSGARAYPMTPNAVVNPSKEAAPVIGQNPPDERTTATLKWGNMSGEHDINLAIQSAYEIIVKWRKNIMTVPRGSTGESLIKELTRLSNLYVNRTQWEGFSLTLMQIFLPLMLQKPHARSKARDHTKYLKQRLEWWSNGELKSLLKEGGAIQKKLMKKKQPQLNSKTRKFAEMIMQGKISAALRLVNSEENIGGVHQATEDIIELLRAKHPPPEPLSPEAVIRGDRPEVPDPVIYEHIDGVAIHKAAKQTNGTGGPTHIDSDVWKQLLCGNTTKKESEALCNSISGIAKRLCREEINAEYPERLLSSRLIPLDKDPGSTQPQIRPIGIGEVLRRIMGRAVIQNVKEDIQVACGSLQAAGGVASGIEAVIHSMKSIFDDEETDIVMLVDADNAFNRLNRQVALENIWHTCPPLAQYLTNTYCSQSKLFLDEGKYIYSQEGTTQGDNCASAFYCLSTKPLIDHMKEVQGTKQAWFADDASGGGKIQNMKTWWDELNATGPRYGYFPKASKTIIIVKRQKDMDEVERVFGSDGITITLDGERHLGAALGSQQFREKYVKNKVAQWVHDVEMLAEIGKEEPQAAYCAYIKGMSHRWAFVQRTIGNISELFSPLEKVIRNTLLPSILGREISDTERCLLALPIRYGGLAIANPIETADREYNSSLKVTSPLSNLIQNQDDDIENLDREEVDRAKKDLRREKEALFDSQYKEIITSLPELKRRCVEFARQKGASNWLSCLPLKKLGYTLNKEEFRDAVALRYGWNIEGIPQFCACGNKNNIDHLMICKKGGYIIFRHNRLRDCFADFLKLFCNDVRTEPRLIPTREELVRGSEQGDGAKLDVSARGIWSPLENTYLDIRVTHPNTPSQQTKSIDAIYATHEKEKKRKYLDRILQVEKSSFTPVVMSTAGGFAPEAERLVKRIAERIAHKKKEAYSDVMRHIRTKLRITLLKTTLISLKGFRGSLNRESDNLEEDEVDFNLIPNETTYECR